MARLEKMGPGLEKFFWSDHIYEGSPEVGDHRSVEPGAMTLQVSFKAPVFTRSVLFSDGLSLPS